MQLILNDVEPEAHIVISPERRMTEGEFWKFCEKNPDLRIERTAEGEIEIMPPTGLETGQGNSNLGTPLGHSAERDGRGAALGSSTQFILPNGAVRTPDASWVALS